MSCQLQWRAIAIALAPLLLAACSEPTGQREVAYNMAWLPQGSQAGIVAAVELGFYKKQGLSVRLARGFGAIRTVNEIDQGMFEFGYGDPVSVLLNRAHGGRALMVGSINSRWPAGLCFVSERRQVETPRDLIGLTVGGGHNSPVQAILPVWLGQQGIKRSQYTLLQMDPSVVDAALIQGSIDVAECWQGSNKAVIEHRAAEANLSIGWLKYSDFGLDLYGSGIVTSDDMINIHPEIVSAFLKASYEGYAWVIEHPNDAVDLMLKKFPTLKKDITAQQVVEIIELTGGKESLGEIDEERMVRTVNFIKAAYELPDSVTASEMFSTVLLQ